MSYQYDQKVGKFIYVYEIIGYWDKGKKQCRQKRKYLGRRDTISGEIINTKIKEKNRPVKAYDYGNIYFLKELAKKLGIIEELKRITLGLSDEIMTLVYYTLSEGEAYYLTEKWCEYNYVGIKSNKFASQRLSEIFFELGSSLEKRIEFFRGWIKRQKEINTIYYDITSLSTYAKWLDLAEWGYNRDNERLRQVNIGVVYGAENQMPLYYQLYSGSINDVRTLKNIKKYNSEFGIKDVIYVLDTGFYSQSNIDELKDERIIIPVPLNTNIAKEMLKEYNEELNSSKYMFTFNEILYTGIKKSEGIIKEFNQGYDIYIFRNKQMYDEGETNVYKILLAIEEKINRNKYISQESVIRDIEEIVQGYLKYFEIIKKDKIYLINKKDTVIEEQIKKFGTFILLTNVKNKTPIDILLLYKQKESIEKIFDCMKNDIDRERLRVHTGRRAEGVIFITYISLIIAAYIEKIIRLKKELNKYTKKEIIYELKKLKITEFANGLKIINVLTKKIKTIFNAFSIDYSNLN